MTEYLRHLACDETYTLPPLEALIAATLALMTGYVQSQDGSDHRSLMARKLVLQLQALSEHTGLSAPLRQMLAGLQARWQVQLETANAWAPSAVVPTPLWHIAPQQVQ